MDFTIKITNIPKDVFVNLKKIYQQTAKLHEVKISEITDIIEVPFFMHEIHMNLIADALAIKTLWEIYLTDEQREAIRLGKYRTKIL